jgi:hypothetical protein
VERVRKEIVGEPPNKDEFERARRNNEQFAQSFLGSLDKSIRSWWILPRDKGYLKMFRFLIQEQRRLADSMTSMSETIMEWDYRLRNSLFYITLEIQLTKGLTAKNIGTLKSRMDKILDNPSVKQLEKIMHDNEEALRKLDKNRQQVLRDSLV